MVQVAAVGRERGAAAVEAVDYHVDAIEEGNTEDEQGSGYFRPPPITERTASVKPRNISPELPMKIRAGWMLLRGGSRGLPPAERGVEGGERPLL